MFKHYIFYIFLFILLGYGALLIFYHFCPLKVSSYMICTSKLEPNDSLKIIQLSDLHGSEFSNGTDKLIQKIKDLKPDIITITGDLIDIYHYSADEFEELLISLQTIAPTYLIYGNHEVFLQHNLSDLNNFEENIAASGVTLLHNQSISLTLNSGKQINLMGISDPINIDALPDTDPTEYELNATQEALQSASTDINHDLFSLLLAHRPEYFKLYNEADIDLILSGHTHGGLIYFPLFGGLYASNQGFFPKYSAGLYHLNQSQMIVSRGLGNSSKAIRIFNCPELICITICSS